MSTLVRSAATSGFRTSQPLIVEHAAGTATLQPVVEPLRVHNEIVGGLLIFPTGDGLDDLDAMVAQAAKLALNVQLMRDYVRFRSEAGSLAEVFKTLFAGAPRHPGELLARAQRLGISLPGPARLITIGFPNEAWEASEPPNSGLHLSLARSVADLRPGAVAVIVDDDLIVFAPVNPKEEPAQWNRFVSRMLATVESHAGVRPIAAESRLCRRLSDYREARIECGRVMTLARMFGKTGPLSQADFGPFAVLLSAVDQPSARDFVRHMLGAIEDYDARNGSELLHTLTRIRTRRLPLSVVCRPARNPRLDAALPPRSACRSCSASISSIPTRYSDCHWRYGCEISARLRRYDGALQSPLRDVASTPQRCAARYATAASRCLTDVINPESSDAGLAALK